MTKISCAWETCSYNDKKGYCIKKEIRLDGIENEYDSTETLKCTSWTMGGVNPKEVT
jgi:hypothetical protein